jgi:hypothetical protein
MAIIHCQIVVLIKILNGQMRTYRQHYMKWHSKSFASSAFTLLSANTSTAGAAGDAFFAAGLLLLTYGMLHYLNNSKPAAKKASPAAPAVEVLADSNVKALFGNE